jgi:hypothetical protein
MKTKKPAQCRLFLQPWKNPKGVCVALDRLLACKRRRLLFSTEAV